MLGAIGEFERDLINERTTEGIARAKVNGVKFGPKCKLSADKVLALQKEAELGTLNKSDLARKYEISRATLYRIIGQSSGGRK